MRRSTQLYPEILGASPDLEHATPNRKQDAEGLQYLLGKVPDPTDDGFAAMRSPRAPLEHAPNVGTPRRAASSITKGAAH